MKDSDYLYIFFHIPKCAGVTFRYHLVRNLEDEEQLLFDQILGELEKQKPFFDYKDYEEDTRKYFSALSEKKKERLKIIYGHYVPYGIHKFFSKPARYFTFFRDPVNRSVSLFNHKKGIYEDERLRGQPSLSIKRTFLVNDKSPSFEKWFGLKYNPKEYPGLQTMTNFLYKFGYAKRVVRNKMDLTEVFKKFYFVGITENFDNDSLFLYNKLGINKFFINQNISRKYFRLGGDKKLKRKIINKSKPDVSLYKHALRENRIFQKSNKEYSKIVKSMKIKRFLFLPFTQILFAPKDSVKRIIRVRSEF